MSERWAYFWAALQAGDVEAVREHALAGAALAVNHAGDTGLIRAAKLGRVKCVHALIEASDANVAGKDGRTALMAAASGGRREVIEILLSKPNTDLFMVDHEGQRADQIAQRGGRRGCALFLRSRMEALLLQEELANSTASSEPKRKIARL